MRRLKLLLASAITAAALTVPIGAVSHAAEVTGNVSVTVTANTPTVKTNAITYTYNGSAVPASAITGTAYNSWHNNDANWAVAGTWSWVDAAPTTAGTYTKKVKFTPSNRTNYNEALATVSVTISKADVAITNARGSTITYGQTLNYSTISATTSVGGTWAWSSPTTKPNAGSQTYSAVFTPHDSANYKAKTINVSLSVNKAGQTLSLGNPINVGYGTAAKAITPSGTMVGTPTWNTTNASVASVSNGTITFGNVGTATITCTYPGNANYSSKSATVAVTVTKATPTLTAGSATQLTYQQSLTSSAITAGTAKNPNNNAVVPGTWAWTNPAIVPNAGTSECSVTFTPNDKANYNANTIYFSIYVTKAAQNPFANTGNMTKTYGDGTYNNTFSGIGSLTVGSSNPSVATATKVNDGLMAVNIVGAGTTTINLSYAGDANYNPANKSVTLTVNKNTPTIAVKHDASHLYGTRLSGFNLVTTKNVNSVNTSMTCDGTVTFNDASAVLTTGTHQVNWTFTPASTQNYNPVTGTTSITIEKHGTYDLPAEGIIDIGTLTASSIVQGNPLSYSTIAGKLINHASGDVINGAFKWATTSVIPEFSDSNKTDYKVIFTPVDTNNYSPMTMTCKVKVDQRTPIISNVTYSIARAGNTLSSLKVVSNGTDPITIVSVDGDTKWNEDEIMEVGTRTYSIAYCADDTVLYQTAYTNVAVSVEPKLDNPITTKSDYYTAKYSPNGTFNLEAHANTSLKYTSNNPELFTVSEDGTVTILSRGEGSITISALEDATYSANNKIVNVLIEKGDYNPVVTASTIKYGQPISASVLTTTNGSANWVSTLDTSTILTPGEYTYKATWVPTDSNLYNPAETTVTLKVIKATVVPSIDPFTASLYYNQSVKVNESAYTFTSAVTGSDVTGTFSYNSVESICSAVGERYCNFTFTADPVGCYEVYTGKIKITGVKQTPDVTISPVEVIYGKTLAEINPTIRAYDTVTGGEIEINVEWKTPAEVPTVGTKAYVLTVTPVDSAHYFSKEYTCDVTVTQQVAVLTDVAAHDINYGQTLADSEIAFNSNVDGSIMWDVPATKPVVGIKEYTAKFIPTDAINYATIPLTIQVNTNKTIPTIATASLISLAYGQKLSDLPITYTCTNPYTKDLVKGVWTWETPDVIPTVNPQTFNAIFTPTDTSNYAITSIGIVAPVVKADPVVTITASSITFGDSLAKSNLTVTGHDGTAMWEDPDTIPGVNDSEKTEYNVIFKPTDTANFNILTVPTRVKVLKKMPQLSDVTATGITYGQKLEDSTLEYTSDIEGTIKWKNSAIIPSVADAGVTEYDVVFTPVDINNYEEVTIGLTLDVSRYIPRITENNIRTATYGEKLSDIAITYTANNHYLGCNVPGTWTWEFPDKLPTVNPQTYNAIFTPKDIINYSVTSIGIQVDAVKGDPVFTLTTPEVPYGRALRDIPITVNGTPGNAAWLDGDIVPTVVDSDKTEYSVVFTPDDTTNFNVVTTTLAVHVVKEEVKNVVDLSVLTATGVTYGDKLSDSTINGIENLSVPGMVAWVNPDELPNADNNDTKGYKAKYVPYDNANYESSIIEIMVHVDPRAVSFSDVKASDLTYGQKLSESTITGVTDIPGTWAFVNASHIPTVTEYNDGVLFEVIFTPSDAGNYTETKTSIPVKVVSAPPQWHSDITHTISATPITYGDMLSTSTISGDVPVPGYYEWIRPAAKPTVMDSDNTNYGVRFISTDPNYTDYDGLYCTVHVNPYAYKPEDFTNITATSITYGQVLDNSDISGESPIAGRFVWSDGSIKPSVADSETTVYYVTFIPKDSVDYSYVTGIPVKLKVTKTAVSFTPMELGTFKTTPIVYPNPLSTSTISGVTNVAGHFEWVDGTIVPNVDDSGKKTFRAVFIPEDDNYVSKEIDLYVTVTASNIEPGDFSEVKGDSLTYGTRLADVRITGVSPIPGKFAWARPDIMPEVSDSNKTEYTIIFTPDDNNYNQVEFKVKLVVMPATPGFEDVTTVTVNGSSITYGQKLSESVLTGDMPVPGHFEWVAPNTIPTVKDSGTTAFAVTFIPDSNNYTKVNNLAARITIMKKAYTASDFKDIKASDVELGDMLSTSTITAKAPIDGKFAWNKPTYVPIRNDSNKTAFAVTFIPSDLANYDSVALTCTVKIVDKELDFPQEIITSMKASRLTYGQKLSESTITGKTPCAGKYEWIDGNKVPTVSDSDATRFQVRFVSADSNYNDVDNLYLTVTVDKKTLSSKDVTGITASPITLGQSLASSKLSGSCSIPGKFEWDNSTIIPISSDSGTTKYSLSFIPDDSKNYSTITGLSVSVAIGTVTPDISGIKLSASDIAFGESLANSSISGKLPKNPTTKEEIPGQYKWVDETIKPAVSDSKITEYKVVFVPTDLVGYTKSAETTLKLNIVRNNPTIDVADIAVNFGSGPITLSAKSNSTGAISYSTSDTDVITIKRGVATVVGVGEADVLVKVAQTSSYNEGSKLFKIVVNASTAKISGKTSYTVKFGEPSFYLDAKAEVANIPLTYKVTSGSSVTVAKDGKVTPVKDGTSVITVSAESNGYGLGDFNVTVTVLRVPGTITTSGNVNKVWGDPDFKLDVSTNSTAKITFTSSNTNVISITGNTAHITGVGQANILASTEAGNGYDGASTTFYINVVKATPVVQQVGIYKKTLNSAPFKVVDGIVSNGDRTYTSSNTSVASVARDGTVTIINEGNCDIRVLSAATSTMEEAVQIIKVNVSDEEEDPETEEPTKPDPGDDPVDPNKPGPGGDNPIDPTKPGDNDDPTKPGDNDSTNPDDDSTMPGDDSSKLPTDDIGMIDTDGDGVPDTPFDPNRDTDGDGIPDIYDDDIDGDGIPNELDDDVDDDGIPNEDDPDYWALKAYLDGLTYILPADTTIPENPNPSTDDGFTTDVPTDNGNAHSIPWLLIIIVCAVFVIAVVIVVIIIVRKNKK